jgi:membrane protein YdbS with pleckstrin-like domain
VREPLNQLTEMQKQKAESKQQAQEDRVNTALATLSILTIISALTDASGITANLGWLIPENVSPYIQIGTIALVFIVCIVMVIRLFRTKKD